MKKLRDKYPDLVKVYRSEKIRLEDDSGAQVKANLGLCQLCVNLMYTDRHLLTQRTTDGPEKPSK